MFYVTKIKHFANDRVAYILGSNQGNMTGFVNASRTKEEIIAAVEGMLLHDPFKPCTDFFPNCKILYNREYKSTGLFNLTFDSSQKETTILSYRFADMVLELPMELCEIEDFAKVFYDLKNS